MRQLALFPGAVPDEPEAPPEAAPEEPDAFVWAELSEVLPGQLNLFSDRTVRLGRARAAIAGGDLASARRELAELKKRFPDDPHLGREAARVAKLARRFEAVLASPPDARPAALLDFARGFDAGEEPWTSLRRAVLGRLAGDLLLRSDTILLDGEPPGFYLMEAGDLDGARASLARAAAAMPSAHTLFLLGDATLLAGARALGRRAYLEALVLDPFDARLAAVLDEEVRALPDVARDELELEEDPAAWSAPVGVVTGVLPSPAILPREALAPILPEGRTAAEREALERSRAFLRALAEAASPEGRGAGAVAARRAMKQISPPLFAAYMDRMVRGKGG